MRRIFIRADGSSEIGLGHVVRSLALVEMLKADYECVFAIQNPSDDLYRQISAVCNEVLILPATNQKNLLANELEEHLCGDELVVLDGYKFDMDYQAQIKKKGCKLLCIDDIHAYHFLSDAIINYTGGIDKNRYKCEQYTTIYTGPDYILLRQPFLKNAIRNFTPNTLRSVLVCLGGSDYFNLTSKIVGELSGIKQFEEICVVTGSGYKHQAALEKKIQKDQRIKHYQNLSAEQMVDVMKRCGIAVCSPSSVSYEYLTVGGVLFILPYAENQLTVRDYLVNNGLAFEYSEAKVQDVLQYNFECLQSIAAKQKSVFDGKSCVRIREIVNKMVAP